MLIQFNFKNYKSFRDEATLDLSALKIKSFEDRVIQIGKEKILPVAAIYGANASGKSNVYKAFFDMSEYVAFSLYYGDDAEKFEECRPTPFLFDNDSKDKESLFEVYFTVPRDDSGRLYNYGFCIGKNGVTEEWLNSKAKTAKKYSSVFYRSENALEFNGFSKADRKNIEVALEKQVLIISLGAKLKIDKCKLVRDWFLANQYTDFGDLVTNYVISRRLPREFIEDKDFQKRLIEYMASFDDSIKDFKIEKSIQTEDSEKMRFKIQALHENLDVDEMTGISLRDESAGTLKMFALYFELQDILRSGGVFFIDELNARLHPLLVRNVILTFLNPEVNVNHAQLIFTTHDTWQLSNNLLRKDEVWFVEKDNKGISSLYSLADFCEDSDKGGVDSMNYEKDYLLGKYGAIPTLRSIDVIRER